MSDETKVEGDRLGECVRVFKPRTANIVLGFFFGALLVAGGLAMIGVALQAAYLAGWNLSFQVDKGWCWLAVGLVCLLGVVFSAGGVGLALFSRYLLSHRVEVHENGFRYCSGRSVENVRWPDISLIQQTTVYQRLPLVKGPAKMLMPQVAETFYVVTLAGGKVYRFDRNTLSGLKALGRILREQADRHFLRLENVEKHP